METTTDTDQPRTDQPRTGHISIGVPGERAADHFGNPDGAELCLIRDLHRSSRAGTDWSTS